MGVVRIRLAQLLHRVGVGTVELLAIGLGVLRVPHRERFDVGLLLLGDLVLERHRHLHGVVGLLIHLLLHRQIEVRPEHERPAPVGHGGIRIEARGFLERAQRLGVVEAVGQP